MPLKGIPKRVSNKEIGGEVTANSGGLSCFGQNP